MADDRYQEMREILYADYRMRHGELDTGGMQAIEDYIAMQAMKDKYQADIDTNGVMETVYNGRQKFRRENKAVGMVAKVATEQIKILKAIGLVKASKASAGAADANETDEENDFDTY